jgi:predicted tellurium resistance membrane protein TerC
LALISDPQAWLSFLILALLEIVLGIDNIIFLVVLVERLPPTQQRSARLMGLSFAMLTRIALLFSVTWMATLTATLFSIYGDEISGRDLILFAGGADRAVHGLGLAAGILVFCHGLCRAGRRNKHPPAAWPVLNCLVGRRESR